MMTIMEYLLLAGTCITFGNILLAKEIHTDYDFKISFNETDNKYRNGRILYILKPQTSTTYIDNDTQTHFLKETINQTENYNINTTGKPNTSFYPIDNTFGDKNYHHELNLVPADKHRSKSTTPMSVEILNNTSSNNPFKLNKSTQQTTTNASTKNIKQIIYNQLNIEVIKNENDQELNAQYRNESVIFAASNSVMQENITFPSKNFNFSKEETLNSFSGNQSFKTMLRLNNGFKGENMLTSLTPVPSDADDNITIFSVNENTVVIANTTETFGEAQPDIFVQNISTNETDFVNVNFAKAISSSENETFLNTSSLKHSTIHEEDEKSFYPYKNGFDPAQSCNSMAYIFLKPKGYISKFAHADLFPSTKIHYFNSIFEKKYIKELMRIHKEIVNTSLIKPNSTLSIKYGDICGRGVSGLCYSQSIAQYFQMREDKLDEVTYDEFGLFILDDYIYHVLTCSRSPTLLSYRVVDHDRNCRGTHGQSISIGQIVRGFDDFNYGNATSMLIELAFIPMEVMNPDHLVLYRTDLYHWQKYLQFVLKHMKSDMFDISYHIPPW